jgi:hypothetical protein
MKLKLRAHALPFRYYRRAQLYLKKKKKKQNREKHTLIEAEEHSTKLY